MTVSFARRFVVAALPVVLAASVSRAAVVITEVDPTGSSNAVYKADWFELTNTGASAQDITGWKMDDNSDAFATAVPMTGVTSIGPGQSVVFVEDTGTTDATVNANFESFWFGSNVPAGFIVANYGGTGVGLSSGGDGVNIFDASGNQVTGVLFGTATTGVSFDNTAGLGAAAPSGTTASDPTISTLSVLGVDGAFDSVGAPIEVGSPGNLPAAPEPASLGVLGVGGLSLLTRRRK